MSHMSTFQTKMDSLDCIKQACQALGLTFKEHQKTAEFYAGKTESCDHAIGMPNTRYEVGLVEEPDRTYSMKIDHYDRNVEKAIGRNGSKIVVEHNIAKATRAVGGMGTVTSIARLENGAVVMKIRGY